MQRDKLKMKINQLWELRVTYLQVYFIFSKYPWILQLVRRKELLDFAFNYRGRILGKFPHCFSQQLLKLNKLQLYHDKAATVDYIAMFLFLKFEAIGHALIKFYFSPCQKFPATSDQYSWSKNARNPAGGFSKERSHYWHWKTHQTQFKVVEIEILLRLVTAAQKFPPTRFRPWRDHRPDHRLWMVLIAFSTMQFWSDTIVLSLPSWFKQILGRQAIQDRWGAESRCHGLFSQFG